MLGGQSMAKGKVGVLIASVTTRVAMLRRRMSRFKLQLLDRQEEGAEEERPEGTRG